MNSKQTVSREECRSPDNRVTCIIQSRWPANEIDQWEGTNSSPWPAPSAATRDHSSPES